MDKIENVEQLKEKYGELYRVALVMEPDDDTIVEVEYLFQKPKVASYDRYIKSASSSMSRALRTFAFDNIIPEHKEKLEKDLEKYPALSMSVGDKLMSMLGLAKSANLTRY